MAPIKEQIVETNIVFPQELTKRIKEQIAETSKTSPREQVPHRTVEQTAGVSCLPRKS